MANHYAISQKSFYIFNLSNTMAKTKTAQDFNGKNPFQRHDSDTGSPEVQIRLLSSEINMLQDHLINHPKDFDAKRSLLKKVARRRKFMKYLKATKLENYQTVSKKLGIKV